MNEDQPTTAAEHGKEPDSHHQPTDPFLAILVQAINHTPGWEIGVILHVNGVTISGMLCSMTSFFREQAEIIRQTGSPETAEVRASFAKTFDWLAEETEPRSAAEPAESDGTGTDGEDLPQFIHLRAATVHAPGADAPLPEILWRGRLGHVSGWSIGNFGPKPPPRSEYAT